MPTQSLVTEINQTELNYVATCFLSPDRAYHLCHLLTEVIQPYPRLYTTYIANIIKYTLDFIMVGNMRTP